MKKPCPFLVLVPALLLLGATQAGAIIFLESGDPQFHTSTPGDNSGWQYEGQFLYFLGVPIAPHFFVTAKHIGGSVGNTFTLHGDTYVTIGYQDCGTTDLRVWEVDHSKPFVTYAPISSGAVDVSSTATVMGRGTQRGSAYSLGGVAKGWLWVGADSVQRWGRNVVEGVVADATYGNLLYCNFDSPGIPGECHLSTGDSSGGLFVLENGLWRLAGLNLAVDGPFSESSSGSSQFYAALFDCSGLYFENSPGVWSIIPGGSGNVPTSFYSTQVSSHNDWVQSVTGIDGSLAPESFSQWLHWYYTPAQLANPAVSGPLADSDGDGISTLLEYAFNLDPTYSESVIMTPGTGLRGLPVVSTASGTGGNYLTVEFVRRTASGGADVIYTPQFSDDLINWYNVGTESVTSINSRWDRVVITDAVPTTSNSRRFARVKVVLAN